jgi:hypothetical protein
MIAEEVSSLIFLTINVASSSPLVLNKYFPLTFGCNEKTD